MEYTSMKMVLDTKVTGIRTFKKVKAKKNGLMDPISLANIEMVRRMVKVTMFGLTTQNMMVTGSTII